MKKNGFTLAEVLIVLAIIGIVAALTIPSFIAEYKYRIVSTRVAKFVSTTENAARTVTVMGDNMTFDAFDSIVLYKSKTEDNAFTRTYELKDGTTIKAYNPYGDPLFEQGESTIALFMDPQYRDSKKYGTLAFNIDFYHNVSGLNDLVPDINFVMTTKGYVLPRYQAPNCAKALSENKWKLTKQIAQGSCKKTTAQ